MATAALSSLQFISNYNPEGGLASLVEDSEVPLALNLTLFLKDTSIALMHSHANDNTRTLSGRVHDLMASGSYKKLYADLRSMSSHHPLLSKAVEQFQRTLTMIAHARMATRFMQVSSLTFSSTPARLLITYPTQVPLLEGLHKEELITALLQLDDEEREQQFKYLTAQQTIEIANDDRTKEYFPRIFISLSHESALKAKTLDQLLLGVNDTEHAYLHQLLKQYNVQSKAWFIQGFKRIRQHYADISNAQAAAIDKINRDFIFLESHSEITEQHILDTSKLAGDIKLAYQAEERLHTLIKGIITDPLTEKLFSDMSTSYQVLKKRVSQKLAKHQHVSGCPYGILYLKAINNPEDDSKEELLTTVCMWGFSRWQDWVDYRLIATPDETTRQEWKENPVPAYMEGLHQLSLLGINSVQDLMRLKIFNAQMLASYVDWKKEKRIDARKGNIIEQFINFFWTEKDKRKPLPPV